MLNDKTTEIKIPVSEHVIRYIQRLAMPVSFKSQPMLLRTLKPGSPNLLILKCAVRQCRGYAKGNLSGKKKSQVHINTAPVSYTHLDVYKRQLLSNYVIKC